MFGVDRMSDQLYTWSDEEHKFNDDVAPPPRHSATSAAIPEAGVPEGLADRALQEVRQGRLQVRAWPGARSQVLPVAKYSWGAAGDGVRAAGLCRAGRGLSCKPLNGSQAVGGDLRDQPRAAETEGGVVAAGHEPYVFRECPTSRGFFGCGRPRGQYDSGLSLCCRRCGEDQRW